MSETNQICAKAVFAHIMSIVFTIMKKDLTEVGIWTVSVSELLEFTNRNLNERNSILLAQGFS